jgi:hypothetical protein
VISIDGEEEIRGERNYLFDIAKFDLVEYGKFCESKNIVMGEYGEDILAVGFWKKDGSYEQADVDWRKSGDEEEEEDAPSMQCRNTHTFDKVKEVIQILRTLDNGDCVDGETFSYIVSQLGFEEYLLRYLIMTSSNIHINDLLAEKKEINGY